MKSFTYFIQAGENGPIKIGRSSNPNKRLREIQLKNPEELRLLKVVEIDEYFLHEKFKDEKLRGEWYKPEKVLSFFVSQEFENLISENKVSIFIRLENWIKQNEKNKRRFALRLGITPSFLTLFLQGKRRLSPDLALKIENATNGRIGRLELLYPVDC